MLFPIFLLSLKKEKTGSCSLIKPCITMELIDHLYCLILAGGKGKRLWPSSRNEYPKQFIDFFGVGRTQLQQTYDRLARLVPANHIIISTYREYVSIVKEQLPHISDDQILDEPIRKDTAPAVAWAAYRITKLDKKATILVTPSDQDIRNEDAFRANVHEALSFMEKEKEAIVAMGVRPTRPEPGYGYIQRGDNVDHDIYTVKSFTEKPNREFAQLFVDSGEFYWNTGMFFARAKQLLKNTYKLLPTVLKTLDEQNPNATLEEERAFLETNYYEYPNIPIDRTLLERASHTYLLKCDYGWADMGTWHSIYEEKSNDGTDNVIIDSDVLMEDCSNCVVKLPQGKLAVINGLDDYIVAEQDNVLLICKKEDSSALIRKYVTELQVKKGEEYC